MKLIFDLTVCQPIGNSKYHGGGIYGYILFKAIYKHNPQAVFAYINKSRYIPKDILDILEESICEVYDSNSISLMDICNVANIHYVYSPLYHKDYMNLLREGITVIVTFHGLRALEMNQDKYEYIYSDSLKESVKILIKKTGYYKKLFNKYWGQYRDFILHKNSKIITISEHSKSSLLYYYPELQQKDIPVFYSPSTTMSDYLTIRPYLGDKYYLLISANRWLKNAYRAIQALDILYEKFPKQYRKTIVVGLRNNSKVYKKIKHKECFIFIDYVSQEVLESLYKGAYVFIYPTLNEGFGYPPLEAMKYGIPVACSPFASVTEVCSDSVKYFNPYSVDEIANRLIQFQDKTVYDIYSHKSLSRYKYITEKQNKDIEELVNYLLNIDN